jgi:hypothetical protein
VEASDTSKGASAPWATDPVSPGQPAVSSDDSFAERPEVFVGAAFAGGLAIAIAIKWLGSR